MIAVLLILLTLSVSAAEAQHSLTASVDRSRVPVGETISLTITFDGASTGVPTPNFPKLSKLKLESGPYTETKFEIINMRRSSKASWTYVLRATSAGGGSIGASAVKYKGKVYRTKPIRIQIDSHARTAALTSTNPDVFVRVYADKTSAYPGEQVILTYKVFFSIQITTPEIAKLPKATGFWTEEFAISKKMSLRDEVIDGRAYKSGVFRKVALFPTTSGELVVEPMTIKIKVERQKGRRSRTSDPFFSFRRHMTPMEVRSPSVNLTIKSLPVEGKPGDFDGAVGRFTIRANLDKTECDAHDAVTLSVLLRGSGNIKTLPPPRIEFPPDFEHYDPKSSEKIVRNRSAINGTKRFEYVLIPRVAGHQELPAIRYSYFDPQTERYVTTSTQPMILRVNRPKETAAGEVQLPLGRKRGVETIATDIAFAKTRPGRFYATHVLPHSGVVFWIYTAGPWLALAVFSAASNRRQKNAAGGPSLKRAVSLAMREFALAAKTAGDPESEAAYRGISRGLQTALAAKLQCDPHALTTDTLEEFWTDAKLNSELLTRAIHVLRECDRSRFTSGQGEDITQLIADARSVVKELEIGRVETGNEA